MTHRLWVDIETYSDVDIAKAGLYKYAQSPAFDILLIAWAVDDGPVNLLDLTEPDADPEPFIAWLKHRDVAYRYAYNAAFEHYCINTWLKRLGHTYMIPLSRWMCVMAHAAYYGYPMGLAATGEAMGLPQDKQKLSIGAALIRKFCTTQRPDMLNPEPWRMSPRQDPEKWNLFREYCRQDVVVEREIETRLHGWWVPEREHLLWQLTCECNMRGVRVDERLVASAIAIGERQTAAYTEEARRITGLDNPNSAPQLREWLRSRGVQTDDLTKATVGELLDGELDGDVRRVLELRQLMAKTSTRKYNAISEAVCADGRVRGLMMYYGASRSGRWAGRIVQPQNLPQNHLPNLDYARHLALDGDDELLELNYGSVPDALSQLIRTAFIPSDGCRFAVADYSAIEARVVAWLAGEKWVLEAFKRGEDIYCATASQMFGVPVEKHGQNAHLRQRGKVAVLALGYGGGEAALEAMGALKMGIPAEDLEEIKKKWRSANPAICRFWSACEAAAIEAMERGAGLRVLFVDVGDANGKVWLTFRREPDPDTMQEFLSIELPTRRKLYYAFPKLETGKNGRPMLTYMSQNQTTRKWTRTSTWGGKLVENITQAVARDCLAETLLRLHEKGLDPVFTVHDEVICEITEDSQANDILAAMSEPISWAPGLPLKGAGFICEYYQKD